MTMFKTISATLLASTLLLGATACGTDETSDTKPGNSVEQTVKSEAEIKTDIASTMDAMYVYLGNEENVLKLSTPPEGLDSKEANDDVIANAVKEAHPDAFAFFDADDTQEIINAYAFMGQTAMTLSMGDDVVLTTPAEAITVEGDTATVDGTKTKMTVAGEEVDAPAAEPATEENTVKLIEKDGKWVIQAPFVDFG